MEEEVCGETSLRPQDDRRSQQSVEALFPHIVVNNRVCDALSVLVLDGIDDSAQALADNNRWPTAGV